MVANDYLIHIAQRNKLRWLKELIRNMQGIDLIHLKSDKTKCELSRNTQGRKSLVLISLDFV